MHRRDLLVGALAAAFTATTARAQIRCTPWNDRGLRRCEVGVALPIRIARQRCQDWCWAACVEAVFALNGYAVDQETIVEKLYGKRLCKTASSMGIATGITGRWTRADGDWFMARADVLWDMEYFFARADAVPQAARELAKGYPLILGAAGHTTVMTGMSYVLAKDGDYRVEKVTVHDPWPGGPSRRVLPRREVMTANFLTKVYVT